MKGLNFRFEKKKPEDKPTASVTEAEEIDTAGQTETFWTRNVRLLNFLICVAVFLVAFGPYSVFQISSCIAENRLEGEEMTVMDVWDLAQIRENLRLKDFECYTRSKSEGEDILYYTIVVEDTYLVMVGAPSRRSPLTYFTVSRMDNDRTVDVMNPRLNPSELSALLGVK